MPFYLGLDGNTGGLINFVETLEHELGHGLGFGVITDAASGFQLNTAGTDYVASGGLPGIWDGFMYDNAAGKTWLAMSNAERQASAVAPQNLAWKSAAMLVAAKATLANVPVINVATPAPSGSGLYTYATAAFGRPVAPARVRRPRHGAAGCGQRRRMRRVRRGDRRGRQAARWRSSTAAPAPSSIKVKNAQDAGAVGVIIANNAAGAAPGLGGTDATVRSPRSSVSQADGVT